MEAAEGRKARWKKTDKPVAKATKKKQSAKKAKAAEASDKYRKEQWVKRHKKDL